MVAVSSIAHKPDVFQQRAIECRSSGIRIVAPAGSGKTETLARRIAALIERGVSPTRILVLTFDNNAKSALNGYLRALTPRGRRPDVKTFNKLGLEILKRDFAGEAASTLPRDSGSAQAIERHFGALQHQLPILSWDGRFRKLLDVFESLKNQGFAPGDDAERAKMGDWLRRDYLQLADDESTAVVADFWGMPDDGRASLEGDEEIDLILNAFAEHDRMLRDAKAMEIVDQKLRAVHALRRNSSVQAKWRASFTEVMVDECQDINRLDALLIWSVLGQEASLVLAGDDDQTLYEFRNAHSLYLREPERFFQGRTFETIPLEVNYRSPATILDHANAFIAHNTRRIEKGPKSGVRYPGELKLIAAGNRIEQHQEVIRYIRDIVGKRSELGEPIQYRDIAVICHDAAVEKAVAAAVRSAGLPVLKTDRRGYGPLVENGVEIINWFKAKGRQWTCVILPDCDDRVLPNPREVRGGDVEAVRRLFYVAMTRATERLVIGYVRGGDTDVLHRAVSGEVIGTNGASRFLFEAGVVSVPPESPAKGMPEPVAQLEAVPRAVAVVAATPAAAAASGPTMAPAEAANTLQQYPVATPTPVPAQDPARPVVPESLDRPAVSRARYPWQLRQEERQVLAKALKEWDEQDYASAVIRSWRTVEITLRRLLGDSTSPNGAHSVRLIDLGCEERYYDVAWARRLHELRDVRNRLAHGEDRLAPAQRARVGELVQMLSGWWDHVDQRMRPTVPEDGKHSDLSRKISALADRIAKQLPALTTGRPIRVLGFVPGRDRHLVLPLQFALVLRDVRFYVAEPYRWDRDPIMRRLVVDVLDKAHPALQRAPANVLALQADERAIYLDLLSLLAKEAAGSDRRTVLEAALNDAYKIGNGNYPAGIKLNPRRTR